MKVHNFASYLKSKKVNESLLEDEIYGANPEEEMDVDMEDEFELEGEEDEVEEEEVTLGDIKAMLDDLSSRVSALEGGEEGMEEEEEDEEEPTEEEPTEEEEEA